MCTHSGLFVFPKRVATRHTVGNRCRGCGPSASELWAMCVRTVGYSRKERGVGVSSRWVVSPMWEDLP